MKKRKNNFGWLIRKLANLQVAISLLFTIGFFIAIGTVIEQGEPISFYKENYTESNPILGFLNWRIILLFNLNELYTSYLFISLLILFGASLIACTFTTQLPALKKFRLWRFLKYVEQFQKFTANNRKSIKCFNTTIFGFHGNDYHLFRQGKKNYAYSGLIGRVAPIIVHLSIIILLLGSMLGSFEGFEAQEMVPRGEIFHNQNIIKSGNLSLIGQKLSCRVNDFWITYTKDSKINQFYSDLSIIDTTGAELKRKTIFVNEPFVYSGTTIYQTDWDILGLKLKINNDKIVQIPVRKIKTNNQKIWLGNLVVDSKVEGKYTLLLNDLNGSILLYDQKGTLVQKFSFGENFTLDKNNQIEIYDYITTTGLQIKKDPGLDIIYISFLLLMISIYASFISYSQIWSVEKSSEFFVAGKSNRAVLYFQQELKRLLQQ